MPIASQAQLGTDVRIEQESLVSIGECCIGSGTTIDAFVQIDRGTTIGARCKISSHVFVCEGVTIEDDVFIGNGVMFTNDRYPIPDICEGPSQTNSSRNVRTTVIRMGASIGSNATILPGISIGRHTLIGAGAVVTHSVPDYAIAAGVPARVIGDTRDHSQKTKATQVLRMRRA